MIYRIRDYDLLLIFVLVLKAALFPFHSWLPAAMVAPTPVQPFTLLLLKPVFGIIKIIVYIFGIITSRISV